MEVMEKVKEHITLHIICSPKKTNKGVQSKYITLVSQEYHGYSANFYDAQLPGLINEAIEIVKNTNLRRPSDLNLTLAIWLKYTDRPILCMSSKTIKLLAKYSFAIDFDPYEI
jgi:hypothetical protein